MLVLDSDFLIAMFREEPDVLATLKKIQASPERVGTTIINMKGLLFGLKKDPKSYARASDFFHALPVLSYDWQAMEANIKLSWELLDVGNL